MLSHVLSGLFLNRYRAGRRFSSLATVGVGRRRGFVPTWQFLQVCSASSFLKSDVFSLGFQMAIRLL
jgi:hypothetical protein